MLSCIALLLFGSAASVAPRSEGPNGCAFNMGIALTGLSESRNLGDADGLLGYPFEVSVLQHNDRFWLGAGLSWKFGLSGFASGSRQVFANLFGLHGDLAYSVLASKHIDLKMGFGPALRYVSVDRESWHTGTYDSPGRPVPASHQNRFLANVRVTTSLLFHRPGRSAGLELIPIRIEYGPSMFQISPSFSISKFF